MTLDRVSDRALVGLLLQLVRSNAISQDDIRDAANRLEAEGHQDDAHDIRLLMVYAEEPEPAPPPPLRLIVDGGKTGS